MSRIEIKEHGIKIVIGEGWLPWNGVGSPDVRDDQHVEIMFRNGDLNALPAADIRWYWNPDAPKRDVVAYRPAPSAIDEDEDFAEMALSAARTIGAQMLDAMVLDAQARGAKAVVIDPLSGLTTEPPTCSDPAYKPMPLYWRGVLVPPEAYEQAKQLEAALERTALELASVKEDLVVAQACLKQKQVFSKDLHQDARKWRDLEALLRTIFQAA